MAIDESFIAGVVVRNGQWMADSATSLLRSRWAVAASAAQNEKEAAEYAKISESYEYTLVQKGGSVSFAMKEREVSPFEKIIEEGMPAPLSGGNAGTVTEPDGSTRPSLVPPQLQGQELPQYAKDPNPISEEAHTMLETLTTQWVEETVQDNQGEIAQEAAKEWQLTLN